MFGQYKPFEPGDDDSEGAFSIIHTSHGFN